MQRLRLNNTATWLQCSWLAVLLAASAVNAEEMVVSNQREFNSAVQAARPGDTLIMANGVWTDFEMLLEGEGTKSRPITLTAQEKGKVIISGQSNLRMAGEHLVVSGLVFKNGHTPTEAVVSFRKSKNRLANHSRVTEIVIDNFNNPERFEPDYWVALYGKYNRFDHSHLEGKRNSGVTVAVRLDSETSRQNQHRIDHNYFGPRPVLGSNGGETLRIGTSHYSLSDSLTLVENNYFDRCNGELEIISNKSGGNTFRGNVFFESRGTLTLRHGNGTVVEDNVFIGSGRDHTGGIRVINKRQTIRNNYLEGLAGYRFGGALVVMNGVPNSPINRYHQVENATIERNSLINSDHIQLAAGSDAERTAVPITSDFNNNLIYNQDGKDIITAYDDIGGIRFKNNVLNDVNTVQIKQGFSSHDITLERAANGLLYPAAENLTHVGVSRDITPVNKDQTGVAWYPKSNRDIRFSSGRKVDIEPGIDSLTDAIKRARSGDIIRMAPGDYVVTKILVIDKPMTIQSKQPVQIFGSAKPKVQVSFERSTLFEIADGGSLQLRGISVSGKSAPDNVGNSVIRTSRYSMLVNYQLLIDNCEFTDLNINRAFNFFNVSKSTFADRIDISHSLFSRVSGAILKLDKEGDDYGIYNAEYVTISNSHFKSVQGALVDFYRGGTDESTFGPHFSLTESALDSVGAGPKNKSTASVYLHGVQVADISSNRFSNSPAIRVEHTVGEPVTKIVNNEFTNTESPRVKELNSEKENTATIANNTVKASHN